MKNDFLGIYLVHSDILGIYLVHKISEILGIYLVHSDILGTYVVKKKRKLGIYYVHRRPTRRPWAALVFSVACTLYRMCSLWNTSVERVL